MTRQCFNNVEHRDLRVITAGHGAELGDDVMYALTYPAEFRNVQAHYPIVFAKLPDSGVVPLALFGFREKQNLFLKGSVWDAGSARDGRPRALPDRQRAERQGGSISTWTTRA